MRKFISCAVLVTAAMIALASSAAADPSGTATGTSTALITPTTCHTADGNTLCDFVATVTYAGDLTGAANDTGRFVAHSDGSIDFNGKEVGTGTFLGTAGGWTGNFWGHIDPSGTTTGGEAYKGTNGLTDLHLEQCHGESPSPATYCFRFH